MIKRNLKALGLALVAAFAMSAIAATAAQANEGVNFTAAEYPVVATGHEEGAKSENFLESTPGSERRVECDTVTYEARIPGPLASTSLTVTPHYDDCLATGGINATVDLNGCDYRFNTGPHSENETRVHGSADIVCPTGNSITVTIATCTVHVPPQTGLKNVTYHNLASGDVTVEVNINNLKATETDGFLCPFEGNTEVTNGIFRSNVVVEGYEDTGSTFHAATNPSEDPEGVMEYTHSANEIDIDVKTGE